MSWNVNNITLTPNDLNVSSIKHEYHTTHFKKIQQDIIQVKFKGVCRNLIDVKFIKWRCEEILTAIQFCNIFLIDFTELEIASSSEINILLESYQNLNRNFCVIFRDGRILDTFGKLLLEHQKNTDVLSGMNDLIQFMIFNQHSYSKFKEFDFRNFTKMMKFNLYSIEESHVKCKSFKFLEIDKDINIVLINFWGDYRYGSGGDGDGDFISYRIQEICDVTMPIGMIIDITNLQYTWGDNIDFYPYEIKQKNIPMKFIVDFSKEALVNEVREKDICKDIEEGLRMIMLSRHQ